MNILSTLLGSENVIISFDAVAVIFLFIAGFFWGLQAGKRRILLFILSIYGSVAVVAFSPILQEITLRFRTFSSESIAWITVGLFALLTVIFYYVFSGTRVKLVLPLPKWRKGNQFPHILVLSIATVGLLITVLISLGLEIVSPYISQLTESVFLSNVGQIAWFLLPLPAIFATAKYKKE